MKVFTFCHVTVLFQNGFNTFVTPKVYVQYPIKTNKCLLEILVNLLKNKSI